MKRQDWSLWIQCSCTGLVAVGAVYASFLHGRAFALQYDGSDMAQTREPTAEDQMRAYFQTQRAHGRWPSGAELDHVAGTNNYGQKLLRRWKEEGRAQNSCTAPTIQNHSNV
ncbi:hypothetical protein ACIRG5_30050 [Lentzea sp. NPDC102401]|uniref:hypothetical protein n=1 Tax=Lentzea sp. NPDC102401 TaxID=3364128 RepID=UPI00381D6377